MTIDFALHVLMITAILDLTFCIVPVLVIGLAALAGNISCQDALVRLTDTLSEALEDNK